VVTIENIVSKKAKIAVVGLGYVGLPLAAAFGKKVDVIGFEIHIEKVNQLKSGYDATGELTAEDLSNTKISYTTDAVDLKTADFIIVTVPTPIDANNNPDLSPMEKASKTIGQNLKTGDGSVAIITMADKIALKSIFCYASCYILFYFLPPI
jgi:UDP-N-acetyl-D-galactosamine dehydrogenase